MKSFYHGHSVNDDIASLADSLLPTNPAPPDQTSTLTALNTAITTHRTHYQSFTQILELLTTLRTHATTARSDTQSNLTALETTYTQQTTGLAGIRQMHASLGFAGSIAQESGKVHDAWMLGLENAHRRDTSALECSAATSHKSVHNWDTLMVLATALRTG